MIPDTFQYKKATSIKEAVEAISTGNAKILAGGHSLVPAMKLRVIRPAELVDISGIAELKQIREEDGEIIIGAAATHRDIETDKLIKANFPFFCEAASEIGDMQ